MKEINEEIAENLPQTEEETAQSAGAGKKRRRRILDICYIAMFAAVITVCAYIAIPVGEIPVTLQTLAICMAGGFLGWKRGTLSVLVYILLGICGIPVFSGGKNFYALIASASAGYVVGFIFTALVTGLVSDALLPAVEKHIQNRVLAETVKLVLLAAAMVAGVAICYVFGTLWYMLIYKGSATAENLQLALTWCVYPYIVPDLVKIAVAAVLVNRLKRFVK